MKKIAVLGAGFAGLATSHFLLQYPSIHITLFDPNGLGGGASGIAPGLLHPFCSAGAKKPWNADVGMRASKKLLRISSEALGQPVAECSGILRPITTEKQLHEFQKRCQEYPQLIWRQASFFEQVLPGLPPLPSIEIPEGIVVDCKSYLQGLLKICLQKGLDFKKEAVFSLQQLQNFDHILIACGAFTPSIQELSKLPLKPIKGQLLELSWPQELPPLPLPLNSQAYIVMKSDKKSCIIGSTFEHKYSSPDPSINEPVHSLLDKAKALIPPLDQSTIISHSSSLRATCPQNNHIPLAGRLSKKVWILTALGSKGLLHHAWLSELLARAIIEGKEELLPSQTSIPK